MQLYLYLISFWITCSTVGLLLFQNIFTRILFLNSLTNSTIILILFLGTQQYHDSYLDVALVYALLVFISSYSIATFLKKVNLSNKPNEEI